MTIYIINGPNLNLLGKRDPDVYGETSFETYFKNLKQKFPKHKLKHFQSNHEGALIDKLHEVGYKNVGIIINGGGYSHTSVALTDAISAISAPVIEVHISNIAARESFRHHSYIAANARGSIVGLGLDGYRLAIMHLITK